MLLPDRLPAVLAALLAALAVPLAGWQEGGEGGSIEDLVRRAAERERALQAELRPRVEHLVQSLEALERPPQPELLHALRAELDALDPAASPLLLPYVDPGKSPTPGRLLRAREITDGLARRDLAALTAPLLALLESGGAVGREHAIELLGHAPPTDRLARRRLMELFEGEDPHDRRLAATALASRGGPDQAPFFARALADPDPEVVGAVLATLARHPFREAADAVFALVARPAAAAPWIASLEAYLRSGVPVDEERLDALVGLVLYEGLAPESRVALLDLLPELEAPWSLPVERRLEPLTRVADDAVRERALVCLARLGDRSARRALMRSYDELVDENDRWPEAYERRGRILLEIGEPRDAARDFREAIDLVRRQGRKPDEALWVALARAYVLDRKLRQAYETLEEAALGGEELDRLAADPDFRALREHARYGRILRG